MGLGKRIERLLSEKSITIKELSEISDVSYNTIYAMIKRDSNKVDPKTVEKIASALGMLPYELYDFTTTYAIPLPDSPKYLFDTEEHQLQMDINNDAEKLNLVGKREAAKRINELTEIKKYTE